MNIRKLRWWSSVRASLIAAWCVVAVYAPLAGFVQAQSAGETKPLAVVALSGYDALWEDIKFDVKHFRDIERLAMVGDSKWEAGMAVFCKPFTSAKIKYFDVSKVDDAREWIREDMAGA